MPRCLLFSPLKLLMADLSLVYVMSHLITTMVDQVLLMCFKLVVHHRYGLPYLFSFSNCSIGLYFRQQLAQFLLVAPIILDDQSCNLYSAAADDCPHWQRRLRLRVLHLKPGTTNYVPNAAIFLQRQVPNSI